MISKDVDQIALLENPAFVRHEIARVNTDNTSVIDYVRFLQNEIVDPKTKMTFSDPVMVQRIDNQQKQNVMDWQMNNTRFIPTQSYQVHYSGNKNRTLGHDKEKEALIMLNRQALDSFNAICSISERAHRSQISDVMIEEESRIQCDILVNTLSQISTQGLTPVTRNFMKEIYEKAVSISNQIYVQANKMGNMKQMLLHGILSKALHGINAQIRNLQTGKFQNEGSQTKTLLSANDQKKIRQGQQIQSNQFQAQLYNTESELRLLHKWISKYSQQRASTPWNDSQLAFNIIFKLRHIMAFTSQIDQLDYLMQLLQQFTNVFIGTQEQKRTLAACFIEIQMRLDGLRANGTTLIKSVTPYVERGKFEVQSVDMVKKPEAQPEDEMEDGVHRIADAMEIEKQDATTSFAEAHIRLDKAVDDQDELYRTSRYRTEDINKLQNEINDPLRQ